MISSLCSRDSLVLTQTDASGGRVRLARCKEAPRRRDESAHDERQEAQPPQERLAMRRADTDQRERGEEEYQSKA
jgi:hypothetical protein